jgi:hypothetical protein
MPPWLVDGVKVIVPLAGIVIAFVWGYFRLFLDEKIRKAINGKIEAAKTEVLNAVNGQGQRITGVEGTANYLKGRIDGHDAALARHKAGNEATAPLGYLEHARDLVGDLTELVAKAKAESMGGKGAA